MSATIAAKSTLRGASSVAAGRAVQHQQLLDDPRQPDAAALDRARPPSGTGPRGPGPPRAARGTRRCSSAASAARGRRSRPGGSCSPRAPAAPAPAGARARSCPPWPARARGRGRCRAPPRPRRRSTRRRRGPRVSPTQPRHSAPAPRGTTSSDSAVEEAQHERELVGVEGLGRQAVRREDADGLTLPRRRGVPREEVGECGRRRVRVGVVDRPRLGAEDVGPQRLRPEARRRWRVPHWVSTSLADIEPVARRTMSAAALASRICSARRSRSRIASIARQAWPA